MTTHDRLDDLPIPPDPGEAARSLQAGPQTGLEISRMAQPEVISETAYPGQSTWQTRVAVRALAFDALGQLWGAGEGGVLRWIVRPTQITYRTWHSEHGLAGNDVTCLLLAAHPDQPERVICGHSSGWLSVLTRGGPQALDGWQVYAGGGFPIRCLAGDAHGAIWAGSDHAVWDFRRDDWLPVPAPALALAVAQGRLWLGAESGLWHTDVNHPAGWDRVDLPGDLASGMAGVTSLAAERDRLWIAGPEGAAVLGRDGRLRPFDLNLPVRSLALTGGGALVSTSRGIFRLAPGGEVQWLMRQPYSLLAASPQAQVFGSADTIFLAFSSQTDPEWRQLLPPRDPHHVRAQDAEVMQVLPLGDEAWVQVSDHSGSLRRPHGDGSERERWELVGHHREAAPATCALRVGDTTLIGFRDALGLGHHDGLHLRLNPALAYVEALIDVGEGVLAAASDGLHFSADLQGWQRLAQYPATLRQVLLLHYDAQAGQVLLLASDGLYRLEDESLRRTVAFERHARCAARHPADGALLCSDGVTVWDAAHQETLVSADMVQGATIFCLSACAERLFVGTSAGLWIFDEDSADQWLPHTSGLAGRSITRLWCAGDTLWVQSNQGTTQLALNLLSP